MAFLYPGCHLPDHDDAVTRLNDFTGTLRLAKQQLSAVLEKLAPLNLHASRLKSIRERCEEIIDDETFDLRDSLLEDEERARWSERE